MLKIRCVWENRAKGGTVVEINAEIDPFES